MPKKLIGVDFDDVVFNCNESLARFHNAVYGTSYCREDVKSWDLDRLWKCSKEETISRVYKWYRSPEHAAAAPVPGASDAISVLIESYEIHIITARPTWSRRLTQEWLDKHFPDMFSGLHFTDHFEPRAKSKSSVCLSLGIPVFIEDSPAHAIEVSSNGVSVLLFDTPWNQEEFQSGITRVFGWEGILDNLASAEAPLGKA